jgi:hypothetical protein
MKRILTAGAAAAVLCGAMLAQSAAPSTNPNAPQAQTPSAETGEPRIAPGSIIPVQLTKTIDAKKAKTGDEVVAKVTMDMKANGGEVIVPKDTKIVGHITEAQARSKEQKESQLAISFDQAVLKDQPVPLPMSIQAVIGPQGNDNSSGPGATPSPSGTGTTATSPMSGRSPMSEQTQSPPSGPPQSTGGPQEGTQRPKITANTQGVIGISNVTLAPAPNGTQGSVLSSEKTNVRLESGTMFLLRVNP